MKEELKLIIRMREVYKRQVNELKEEWKNGSSKFCKIKDYKTQLNIWEKRIVQYDSEIIKLKK